MPSDVKTAFLGDRESVLHAVSAACRVPPGSSEWNRGVFSIPECPKSLRAQFSRCLESADGTEESEYLTLPHHKCASDPFFRGLTGHGMWHMARWSFLTAHSLSASPQFREPMYVPDWACELGGNSGWEDTLRRANGFGVRNGSVARPSGKWVFDYVAHPDGWRMLNEAHYRTHDRAMDWMKSGSLSKQGLEPGGLRGLFADECCMEALSFLVKSPAMCLRNAEISVSCSDDIVKPDGWVPVDSIPSPPPRCLVFASYRVEPPPKTAVSGSGKWLEVNRWCCAPTTFAFYGFACWDVVSKCPLVRRGKRAYIHVPVRAMHSMDLLDGYLQCASDAFVYPSMVYVGDPENRCPWPCRLCMDLNRKSVFVVDEAQREAILKSSFEAVDKAAEWHEKRSGARLSDIRRSRRHERSSWDKAARKALTRRRAEERAMKWLERGDPGRCAEILRKLRE